MESLDEAGVDASDTDGGVELNEAGRVKTQHELNIFALLSTTQTLHRPLLQRTSQ
jgi:hypothetical protein